MLRHIKFQLRKTAYLLKSLFKLGVFRLILVLLLVFVVIIPAALFFILMPKQPEKMEYGITFSRKYTTEMGLDWQSTYIKILDDLKIKNIRIVAYWDDVEKRQDEFDYSDVIWQLDEAEKRNVNVIMSIGRKVPRWPECFEPAWWTHLKSEEEKERRLTYYILKSVLTLQKYQSIKIWQIENEPFWQFGNCTDIKRSTVEREVDIVRVADKRPIMIQDSGEGGYWLPTYQMADYLGISMYRRIWYNFWGVFLGKFIYFKYPLEYWTYKLKANFTFVPVDKILVTELQAEPWGPGLNSTLSREEKDKTMSHELFLDTINYAQKSGFKSIYFWGAEWWLFEKEKLNEPFYWDTAKAIINEGK